MVKFSFFIFSFLLGQCLCVDVLAQKQAYIFSANGKYGLCTKDRENLVPAQYTHIEQNGMFLVATLSEFHLDIYSADGVLQDNASQVYAQGDELLVALHFTDSVQRRDRYIQNSGEKKFYQLPTATLLFAGKGKKCIPGRVENLGAITTLDSNGKKGLMRLKDQEMFLPFSYDTILKKESITGNYFLGWNDSADYALVDEKGVHHDFAPIVYYAVSINGSAAVMTIDSDRHHSFFYNSKGKFLLENTGGYSFGQSDYNIGRPYYNDNVLITKYNSVLQSNDTNKVLYFMDSEGKKISEDEYTVEYRFGDVVAFARRKRTQQPHTYENRFVDALYNAKTGKYIAKATEKSGRILPRRNGDIFYAEDENERRYYDYYGNVISRMPKSMVSITDTSFVKELYIYFLAVRPAPGAKWRVYNRLTTQVAKDSYDEVRQMSLSKYFIAKTNNKWGVYSLADNGDMNTENTSAIKTIVPAEYDKIETGWHVIYLYKNGERFLADETGKLLFSLKNIDFVSEKTIDGKRLAYSVRKEDYSAIFYNIKEIDAAGKVLYTTPQTVTSFGEPILLTNDRVLYKNNILNLKSGKSITITTHDQRFSDRDIWYIGDKPIAMVVEGKENSGSSYSIYSFMEQKMLLPFGKWNRIEFKSYFSTGILFTGRPLATEEDQEAANNINMQLPTNEDKKRYGELLMKMAERYIGTYTADGKFIQ